MRKFFVDKRYMKASLYVIFVAIVAITYEKAVGNVNGLWNSLVSFFSVIVNILTPFLIGFLIAYLLNPITRFIEVNIFNRIKRLEKRPRGKRLAAIAITYIMFFGLITWILIYLLPEVNQSLRKLFDSIRNTLLYIDSNRYLYNDENEVLASLFDSFNKAFSTKYAVSDMVDYLLQPVLDVMSSLPSSLPQIFSTIYKGTVNFAGALLNILLGSVVSFYMLCEKENYAAIFKKIILLLFKERIGRKVLEYGGEANRIFESFFVGKTIDSIIIGILFFVICLIIKLPYALLLSIIAAVTNMIPYFGPFIGTVPIVFIVFMNDPVKALWTIIAIFILQQFDGIILGPKILGQSTGLKPIGVIFAIMAGGALFGVPGMFFGVPAFGFLYAIFSVFLDKRYEAKYGGGLKEIADSEENKNE